MRWKPSKKPLEMNINPIGINIPSTSSATPGGVLTVTVYECVDLSVAEGYKDRPNGEKHDHRTIHGHPMCRRCNYPYALLDYEKSQAILDCYWGTTENPVWEAQFSECEFDVTRFSELTVFLYIRDPSDSSRARDIRLGTVRVNPFYKFGKSEAQWLELQDGAGRILIGFEYTNGDSKPLEESDFERGNSVSGVWTSAVIKKNTQRIYAESKIRTAQLTPHHELETVWNYQVSHPFIAPLSFAFESLDGLTLLSPYIGGGPLLRHLQNDRCFDIDRSRLYASEITCALEYLHDTRKTFAWLKPKNVLLDQSGHIVLCGFGLFDVDLKNGSHATPEYPAPELLLGQEKSRVADWWTLGVILYELMTGLPPFYDESHGEIRQRILSQPIQFPDSFSTPAKDVIIKLLDRDPAQRLGANGASEVKSHPFFAGIDWNKLFLREYEPAFRPKLTSSSFRQYGVNDPPESKNDSLPGWIPPLKATETIPQITPIQKAYQEVIREDDGWELTWEKVNSTFSFRNRFTGTGKPVPSKDAKLLEYKDEVDDRSVDSTVPSQRQKEEVLEAALQGGHDRVISQLLEYGMDLNIMIGSKQLSPLEWVVEAGNHSLVTLLLDKGADANYPDVSVRGQHEGGPALIKAVETGNKEIARVLAQVTNRVALTRALGLTVDRQDVPMVELLLANGARCEFEEADRPLPQDPLDEGCYFYDLAEPHEFTPPLVRAIKKGNVGLVRLLLSHGANANAGYHSLIWDLYEYDMMKDPIWFSCGWPIELAMELGYQEMVELLLDSDADINLPQPSWPVPGHDCMSVPRIVYQKVTARLRAAVAARDDKTIS
ncbi:protein kinase [Daldinia sp. FL1419]|nr:protein kinase [Daldinia sp. FL1419]